MGVIGFLKGLISPVTDIVSEVVTDKDQRNKLSHDLQVLILEQGSKYEEELTKRHEMDMKSDSWLSKNVRPMSLVFLMAMFVLITIFDGNIGQFVIDETYIPVYQQLLSLVFTFYFGSRGAEKIMKIYKSPAQERADNEEQK